MNKKLPYEDAFEQQMNDLPLPGEEQSWQNMSQLLDEDDKRTFPGGFFRYGGFVLCAIALVGWLYILQRSSNTPRGKFSSKAGPTEVVSQNKIIQASNEDLDQKNSIIKAANPSMNPENSLTNKTKVVTATPENKPTLKTTAPTFSNTNNNKLNTKIKNSTITLVRNSKREKTILNGEKIFSVNEISKSIVAYKEENKNTTLQLVRTDLSKKSGDNIPDENKIINITNTIKSIAKTDSKNISQKEKEDKNAELISNPSEHIISIQKHAEDSLLKEKNIPITSSKDTIESKGNSTTKATKKGQPKMSNKGLLWSAGMSLQQQIPVGGKSVVGYNANGKQSFFADYLPGVYLRVEKQNKWFVQGEFNYSAPQPINEFAYARKTTLDSRITNFITKSQRLKKAYYHQLPLNFNYYIMPHWSTGVGGIYSILHRAVTEQQFTTRNISTQQEIVSTSIVPISGYTDSFLYKSQLQWMLQTNYQWKRFSFGVRYIRDAEPFIRFTHPTGEPEEKKNWSLQFILRFRLWQSGK